MYGYGCFISANGKPTSGGSFDADSQSFFTASGITDLTQKNAVNQLVLDLKSANIWTKMKALYPVVGGTSTAHSYNLINTAQYQLSFSSGWTHSSTGMLPNGTSAYANTGFNGSNWQSTSNMSMGVYTRSNVLSGSLTIDMGAFGVPFSDNFISAYNSGNAGYAINYSSSPYTSFSVTDSKGLYIANRTSSTNTSLWKNGVKLGDGTNTAQSSALATNLLIGAYADQATVKFYSPREIALAIMADTLTNGEISSLNSAVTTFQTSLSRQV